MVSKTQKKRQKNLLQQNSQLSHHRNTFHFINISVFSLKLDKLDNLIEKYNITDLPFFLFNNDISSYTVEIPIQLLNLIFSFLDTISLIKCKAISSTWRNVILSNAQELFSRFVISNQDVFKFNDKNLHSILMNHTKDITIKYIDISGCSCLTNFALWWLSGCVSLKYDCNSTSYQTMTSLNSHHLFFRQRIPGSPNFLYFDENYSSDEFHRIKYNSKCKDEFTLENDLRSLDINLKTKRKRKRKRKSKQKPEKNKSQLKSKPFNNDLYPYQKSEINNINLNYCFQIDDIRPLIEGAGSTLKTLYSIHSIPMQRYYGIFKNKREIRYYFPHLTQISGSNPEWIPSNAYPYVIPKDRLVVFEYCSNLVSNIKNNIENDDLYCPNNNSSITRHKFNYSNHEHIHIKCEDVLSTLIQKSTQNSFSSLLIHLEYINSDISPLISSSRLKTVFSSLQSIRLKSNSSFASNISMNFRDNDILGILEQLPNLKHFHIEYITISNVEFFTQLKSLNLHSLILKEVVLDILPHINHFNREDSALNKRSQFYQNMNEFLQIGSNANLATFQFQLSSYSNHYIELALGHLEPSGKRISLPFMPRMKSFGISVASPENLHHIVQQVPNVESFIVSSPEIDVTAITQSLEKLSNLCRLEIHHLINPKQSLKPQSKQVGIILNHLGSIPRMQQQLKELFLNNIISLHRDLFYNHIFSLRKQRTSMKNKLNIKHLEIRISIQNIEYLGFKKLEPTTMCSISQNLSNFLNVIQFYSMNHIILSDICFKKSEWPNPVALGVFHSLNE